MTGTANDFVKGYPPVVTVAAGNPEALKYGKMWQHDAYRAISPGEDLIPVFLSTARPRDGATVIDFGCGTGRGGHGLAKAGLRVTLVDFVRNCLDADVRAALDGDRLRFVKADLEQPIPVTAEYGLCCDVMEHVPEERVGLVLRNILLAAQHVFFAISTQEDACGTLIGEELHVTIRPYAWWAERFRALDCLVHWSQDLPGACGFYVSAWQDAQTVVDAGIVNTTDDELRANVAHNCAQGWSQVIPHETNDTEVMIVGGGPSLTAFEDEIKAKRAEGVKLITLNGAYSWALERGLVPSAQIIVDARPFNARFTKPVVDGCKYLIASQVHPSVLEGLPVDRTYLWHTGADHIADLVQAHYDPWWPVPGGSTVLLRAIPLLRMLGFKRFHLYGVDSCVTEAAHHAYQQPENDGAPVLPVTVTGGRIFYCHPWMVAQAREFISLIQVLGDEIELAIPGDGLLAHILNTGAALNTEPEV